MKKVPAIPFMTIVKQFALARGLKFFTCKDQMNAVKYYESVAKILNR